MAWSAATGLLVERGAGVTMRVDCVDDPGVPGGIRCTMTAVAGGWIAARVIPGDRPESGIAGACPLCGHRFTNGEFEACHRGCPMASTCSVVRCPSCGNEFPRPGPVTRWIERLLRGKGGGRFDD